MEEHDLSRQANRREMLRLSGVGVLAGVAGSALVTGRAPAAEIAASAVAITHASWIHGHSMQIEYPDRLVSQRRIGYWIDVEGKSGSTNWFHFAIPTPVIVNDVRLKVDSVMLRFSTGSVDAFVDNVHVYDGETLIAAHNNLGLSLDHTCPAFRRTAQATRVLGSGHLHRGRFWRGIDEPPHELHLRRLRFRGLRTAVA